MLFAVNGQEKSLICYTVSLYVRCPGSKLRRILIGNLLINIGAIAKSLIDVDMLEITGLSLCNVLLNMYSTLV